MFNSSTSLQASKLSQYWRKVDSLRLWRRAEGDFTVRPRPGPPRSSSLLLAVPFFPVDQIVAKHDVGLRQFASKSINCDFWRLSSRSFATRGARRDERTGGSSRRHNDAASGGALVNERLVAALCKNRSTPDSVQVRVIAKVGGETSSQVTSLSHAIQLSVQHSKDLIGIALDHEVPVIKVDSIQRLSHEAKKSQSKSRLGSLAEKEVRFRTGIAENDFLRKVDRVVQYLDKGHNCMLMVTTAGSSNREPGAARNMATAILERARNGELMNQLQVSGDQRSVQFRLRPLGSHRNKD